MYIMKNISKYLGVALLLLTGACSKSQDNAIYNPNKDDAKEIHFIQSSIEKEFPQGSETGTIDVEIARTGNKGTYKVFLAQKDEDESLFFTAPVEVTIPDGKYSVTVPVEVLLTDFTMGASYKTTLLISSREISTGSNGAQISQYSDKVTISASYELSWEPYMRLDSEGKEIQQLATYHYSLYYNGKDSGLEVEKAIGANIFRVKDWASGVAFRFILNDDNTCTVPGQSIGYFNSNYNEYVYVADMAEYTGNAAAYSQYPCTFDGVDTFSFYLIYYVSGGYFSQGTETLVFESEPDTTPTINISFEGIENTSTGFRAPKLRFSPNEYAKSYKASIVAGDITTSTFQQKKVRDQLIAGTLQGAAPTVTLYSEDESVWNVPKGNYTAVAVVYDSIDNPAKQLYTERFTFDPDDEYSVGLSLFDFYAPTNNANYSPYNTLIWVMKGEHIASMKYLCVKTQVADYLCEALDMTIEELAATRGNSVTEEIIAMVNSAEGFGTSFSLDQGSEYILALSMTNSFGDTYFASKTASTYGHFASDFDQTKTMNDFLGAFSTTATVTSGSSNDAIKNFRIDITRQNDRDVIIKGMSDMRDFSPELNGYYDEEKHMIIIETQAAGMYESNYARLGFGDGLMIYWGGNSLAIGYIGNTLYWASSPYADNDITSYMFLLFSSPEATSANYLRQYVGSKTYSDLSMVPLKLAPATRAAFSTIDTREKIAAGDRQVTSFLINGDQVPTAFKAAAKSAAGVKTKGTQSAAKTLRTDLQLHPLK